MSTISEALGLTEVWAKKNLRIVEDSWSEHDTVSDTFEDVLKQMREAEFGETTEPATLYEKKVIIAGYHAGLHHAEMKMKHMAVKYMMEQMKGDLARKLRGEDDE